MFIQKFPSKELLNIKTDCHIFPSISDRAYWKNAKKHLLNYFKDRNDNYESYAKKHLTASLYREFYLNGNRSNYQRIYFDRRCDLVCKVVLECFYNDGALMDEIVDLLWLILEESTWTVPAQNKFVKSSDSLPDIDAPALDLFLAETACTLAFVYLTLGEKLDSVSVHINKRIEKRVMTEVVDRFIEHSHFWWMGYQMRTNNWNPWICSNVLACAITFGDEEKIRNTVFKALEVLDNYYDSYPFDGGCDEGASYWNQAGLSMLECLWLLKTATDGQIDFFGEAKVKNTFEYFSKMHTGKNTCINFADASMKIPMFYPSIYKFSKLTDNPSMRSFAKLVSGERFEHSALSKVFRVSDLLTYSHEIETMAEKDFEPELDCYIESLNIAIAKSDSDPQKGLCFAAKGGNNNENHNHNDVGSFILSKNGERFLADSGSMVYTKDSFTERRYTIWTNRSLYHNVPVIGNGEQLNGAQFSSKNVSYEKTENGMHFELDISDTYQTREDIKSWKRMFDFDRQSETLMVTEDFELEKDLDFQLRFLTPQSPEFKDKILTLTSKSGECLTITLEGANFDFEVENIECDDTSINANWPDGLRVAKLSSKAKEGKIKYIIK